MAKQYNIRWKQSDNADLRKAVKNFNAKITRLQKKMSPQDAWALPEKVKVSELKELITTRQDLKREINALKRFSEKGAEKLVDVPDNKYNLKTTKWQRNEMSRRLGIVNRKRNKRHEQLMELDAKSRGRLLGYKLKDIGMGRTDEVALRPMQAFPPSLDRTSLNKRYKAIRKESQTMYWMQKELLLKNNIIKGIEAGYRGLGMDDVVDDIVNNIDNMDFDEFYQIWMTDTDAKEIVSPKPGAFLDDALRENLTALQSTWAPVKKPEITKGVSVGRRTFKGNPKKLN